MGGWAARDSPGTGVGEMVTDWGGIRDQLVEGLYHAVGLLISFSSHCILSTQGRELAGVVGGPFCIFSFFLLSFVFNSRGSLDSRGGSRRRLEGEAGGHSSIFHFLHIAESGTKATGRQRERFLDLIFRESCHHLNAMTESYKNKWRDCSSWSCLWL
jgi:hypothetical protein